MTQPEGWVEAPQVQDSTLAQYLATHRRVANELFDIVDDATQRVFPGSASHPRYRNAPAVGLAIAIAPDTGHDLTV